MVTLTTCEFCKEQVSWANTERVGPGPKRECKWCAVTNRTIGKWPPVSASLSTMAEEEKAEWYRLRKGDLIKMDFRGWNEGPTT